MALTNQKTPVNTPAPRDVSQTDNFPKPQSQKSVKTPFSNVTGGLTGVSRTQDTSKRGFTEPTDQASESFLNKFLPKTGDKMTVQIDIEMEETISAYVERAIYDKKLHAKALHQLFEKPEIRKAITDRASATKEIIPVKSWSNLLRCLIEEYAPGDRVSYRDLATKAADKLTSENLDISANFIETKAIPLLSDIGLLVKADQEKGNSPWLWAYIEYTDTLTKVKNTATDLLKLATTKDDEATAILEQQRKEHAQRQLETIAQRMKDRGDRIKSTLKEVEQTQRENAAKQRELTLKNSNWFTDNSGAVVVGALALTILVSVLSNRTDDTATMTGAMTPAEHANAQAEVLIGTQPTQQDIQDLQARRLAIYAAQTGAKQ